MNTAVRTVDDIQVNLQNGNFEIAVDIAKEIVQENPKDVYCLSLIAQSEFNAGQLDDAKKTLKKALEIEKGEINLNRNLGIIYNKLGKFKKSVKAYLQGVKANRTHPEIMLDVLLMGISLYKVSPKKALRVIESVFAQSPQLKSAYTNQEELPFIQEASNIANHLARDIKYASQKKALDEICLGFDKDKCTRLYGFLDIFHGISAPSYADKLQRPTYHVFPDLEPVPFYDTQGFSWQHHLEDNWQAIKAELEALYQEKSTVRPYIDGAITGNEGLDALADSYDWSSIHLIQAGQYKHERLEKCPVTKKVLQKLPLPVLSGNAPEAFLSVLQPGAEIKPHFGLSNIKLTVHLGLDIPIDCAIRVGDEVQYWQDGKVLIFDDSFEHEAWNRSDKERKVFILEVWHPDLSKLERLGITKIMELQNHVSEIAQNDDLQSLIKIAQKAV